MMFLVKFLFTHIVDVIIKSRRKFSYINGDQVSIPALIFRIKCDRKVQITKYTKYFISEIMKNLDMWSAIFIMTFYFIQVNIHIIYLLKIIII